MTESIASHQNSMELPKFRGGDPFWWLLEVYEFFALDSPPHLMVKI